MSATKQTTIWCDVEKCVGWISVDTADVAAARREARESGWRRFAGGDFCTEHLKTEEVK